VPGQPPTGAISPYAASKWATSIYAQDVPLVVRAADHRRAAFMTYGPRQNPAKIIPYLALNLFVARRRRSASPTEPVDWCSSTMWSTACSLRAAPNAVGRSIDFGTGNLVSIREVVRDLEQMSAHRAKSPCKLRTRRWVSQAGAPNIEDAANLLEWKATTPLYAGLVRQWPGTETG